jgi:hypothetical protein
VNLSAIPYRLIGMSAGAVAILAFVLLAFHWKHQAADRKDQLAAICTETRSAAENPKLACNRVSAQIGQLGLSVIALKGALADQNAKVAQLGQETAQQQADSARASQVAQKRADKAEATSTRLDASSRSGGAPCEPSAALKGAWK